MSAVRARLLDGFDDPTFGSERWEALLAAAGTDIVYLTWPWQRAWWESHRPGALMLIAAERDGRVVALAPFYAESGMVYFIGTGFESGYLDFIGDIGDPEVLDTLLLSARDAVPDFLGFELWFVSDRSSTGPRLAAAADRLGFGCYEEEDLPGPFIDLVGRREAAEAAARKKDAREREGFLRRHGVLAVQQLRDGDDILPRLDEFFDQHIVRWSRTSTPSRYREKAARAFIERLTKLAAHTGWLRFIRLEWDGRPIAFQYGFCYRGRYVREISTFAIEVTRGSPGLVLLRQSLLAALEEGAHTFDFGIGEQPYKSRFATDVCRVKTWGLYPSPTKLRARSAGLVPA